MDVRFVLIVQGKVVGLIGDIMCNVPIVMEQVLVQHVTE